jgi:pilus assembly protein Flp/PilA
MQDQNRKLVEMKRFYRDILADTQGATAIEYGLIVALISVTAIIGMQAFGLSLGDMWNFISDTMESTSPQATP